MVTMTIAEYFGVVGFCIGVIVGIVLVNVQRRLFKR